MKHTLRIGLLDWIDILIPSIDEALKNNAHEPEDPEFYYLPLAVLPSDDNDRGAVTIFFDVLFELAHSDSIDEFDEPGLQHDYSIYEDDEAPFLFVKPEGFHVDMDRVRSVFQDVKAIFSVGVASPRFLFPDDPEKVYVGPVHEDERQQFNDLFLALAQYSDLDVLNNIGSHYDWFFDGPELDVKMRPPIYAFISRDIYAGFFRDENHFKAFPQNGDEVDVTFDAVGKNEPPMQ